MLSHVDRNTILVACMMVNNEIGTRNEVERLAAEVKRKNSRTLVHVDAVQAWMRVPIKLANIDTLAVSGHKIHAPKGVGALYLSDSLAQAFQPPYLGGEQEREKRPGTENLPYAVGLAAAVSRLSKNMKSRDAAVRALNQQLRRGAESLPRSGDQQPGQRRAGGAELQRELHQERDDAGVSGGGADLCFVGQCLRAGPAQPHAGGHGPQPAGHRHGHPGVLLRRQHPRRCGCLPEPL